MSEAQPTTNDNNPTGAPPVEIETQFILPVTGTDDGLGVPDYALVEVGRAYARRLLARIRSLRAQGESANSATYSEFVTTFFMTSEEVSDLFDDSGEELDARVMRNTHNELLAVLRGEDRIMIADEATNEVAGLHAYETEVFSEGVQFTAEFKHSTGGVTSVLLPVEQLEEIAGEKADDSSIEPYREKARALIRELQESGYLDDFTGESKEDDLHASAVVIVARHLQEAART